MFEDLLEFVAVHLDPFAFEQHQTVGGLQEGIEFRFGERLALERHLHFEIQQAIGAKQFSLGLADAHGHLRSGRASCLPPIRNANHQAALFENGDVLQERESLLRPPDLGMKHGARIQ